MWGKRTGVAVKATWLEEVGAVQQKELMFNAWGDLMHRANDEGVLQLSREES
jgi:hypothetical protein